MPYQIIAPEWGLSEPPTNSQQANGLRQRFPSLIPARPYCADDLADGLRIRERQSALERRHVQLNGPSLLAWMPHDIDHPGAYYIHHDANLPPPNFIAINPANGHGHCAVLLAMPVARHAASRVEPLRFFSAVERGIARRIGADRHYAGLITKNPVHPHWRVEWRRDEAYTLPELADWLFPEDMQPDFSVEGTLGSGRNVVIFDELRTFAYREVLKFKRAGATFDQWRARLEVVATGINLQFAGYSLQKADGTRNVGPLRHAEVRAIAKSVAKWTWRHFSLEQFSEIQRRRANARWADHVSAETTRPWEAEGISRRTWYRRRADAR